MTAVFLASPGPVFIDPNQQFVQSNATITTSGSVVYTGYGVRDIYLVINIVNAPTGTIPSLTYTIQEVDPGNQSTALSTNVVSAPITAIGTQILNLPLTTTGAVKVSWTVTGTTPSFTGVYTTLLGKITTAQVGLDSSGVQVPLRMKDASVAAVATDPALVVAVSPNNAVNIAPDVVVTGALGSLGAFVQISTSGLTSVGFQLAAGTLTGTITPELSWDGGTNWSPCWFVGPLTLGVLATINVTNPNSVLGKEIATQGGVGLVRVILTSYTSGTANVTLRASQTNPNTIALAAEQAGTAYPPMVIQVGGNDGTNLHALSTDANGDLNVNATAVDQLSNTSYPDPGDVIVGTSSPTIDAFGNLQIRGPVLTDEGSFRDDFTGSALVTTLTGTLSFTASSTGITGSGTTFTSQIVVGQYIKKSSDTETLYVQVAEVISDTQLTLVSNYAGTTASVAGVVNNWQTVTPSGGSFAVASSIVTMACGTTANATGSLRSLGDFLPYSVEVYAEVSQRIANQTLYLGIQDVVGAPNQQATVQFTGTTNTQVNFVTSYANTVADTQTTLVTLPNGGTTATYHQYKIDLSSNQATLSIDGIVVATNTTHLPSPYTVMYITTGVINGTTAPASNTNLLIDYIFFEDIDRVQIDNDFLGEPMPVQSIVKPMYGASGQVITITLASLANAAARASTAINNTLALYEDAYLFIKLETGSSGTSTAGYVNVYGYGSVDGITYPEGITGTDAGVTLTSPPNLVLLAQINANTNAASKTYGPFSFCRQYGLDRLPALWGVVVVNQTGAAFNATAGNFLVEYQGTNGQLV